MAIITQNDAFITAEVMALITRERERALSFREWKHRLTGFGYHVRDTENGHILETLPHHVKVCSLPPELCA
ncbi:hypothetical protein SAMN04488040_2163 [Sulfitobacter marinus]|uniref:Uncharacterized protein n=1 Tax=Sulfitobacter marinus TaxID=394264 RepID=A0A1I6TBK4_9RHOB|nr:hypothetical protein [Sulfitobacter marinus]SFS86565.1 hypothetical protein SAMN04488040_2163 [Sulfitobacter marinus]